MGGEQLIELNRIRHTTKRYLLRFVPFWLASVILINIIVSTTTGAATYISQSYATKDKLSIGSIVSLENNSTDTVIASASSNVNNLIGVVVNADNSILSFSSNQKTKFK